MAKYVRPACLVCGGRVKRSKKPTAGKRVVWLMYCDEGCAQTAYKRRKAKGRAARVGKRGTTLPESASARMTDAELDALVAERRANLPLWWASAAEPEPPPEPRAVPVVGSGKKWNGKAF